MFSLGQKLKWPITCAKRLYKKTRVVLCKKPLKKTPNIREMRRFWKSAILQWIFSSKTPRSTFTCEWWRTNNYGQRLRWAGYVCPVRGHTMWPRTPYPQFLGETSCIYPPRVPNYVRHAKLFNFPIFSHPYSLTFIYNHFPSSICIYHHPY